MNWHDGIKIEGRKDKEKTCRCRSSECLCHDKERKIKLQNVSPWFWGESLVQDRKILI